VVGFVLFCFVLFCLDDAHRFLFLVPLAQIQHRVNLDFLGRPRSGDSALTTRTMMLMVVGFWISINMGLFFGYNIKWSRGIELTIADWAAFALINGAYIGFIVFVTQSTRSSLREKFLIREQCCYDLEDLFCASCCMPCTVSQMSRHTANYDDYEAVCCSKSGLPDGVRVNQQVVVSKGYVV
jgi:Cys-rich protein (TIGR01571 family)